jgi:hypothetical protein
MRERYLYAGNKIMHDILVQRTVPLAAVSAARHARGNRIQARVAACVAVAACANSQYASRNACRRPLQRAAACVAASGVIDMTNVSINMRDVAACAATCAVRRSCMLGGMRISPFRIAGSQPHKCDLCHTCRTTTNELPMSKIVDICLNTYLFKCATHTFTPTTRAAAYARLPDAPKHKKKNSKQQIRNMFKIWIKGSAGRPSMACRR